MIDVPAGWPQVVSRSATTAVVGFVVLQAKEWLETGVLDTPGTAFDAALVAFGIFVVSAALKWAKS